MKARLIITAGRKKADLVITMKGESYTIVRFSREILDSAMSFSKDIIISR